MREGEILLIHSLHRIAGKEDLEYKKHEKNRSLRLWISLIIIKCICILKYQSILYQYKQILLVNQNINLKLTCTFESS